MRYSTELSLSRPNPSIRARATAASQLTRLCAIALTLTALQSCQEPPASTDSSLSSSTAAVDWSPAELTIASPPANQPDGSAFVQVPENTLEVAQLAAKDGLGSTFSYRLQDGQDIDHFVVDETTGELRFKDLPDWDRPQDADANNNYMVLWQVLSSSGEARSQFLVVQVTDLPSE